MLAKTSRGAGRAQCAYTDSDTLKYLICCNLYAAGILRLTRKVGSAIRVGSLFGSDFGSNDMKYFALSYVVVDDFVARRSTYRDEHLRLARESHRRGELRLAGALTDPA